MIQPRIFKNWFRFHSLHGCLFRPFLFGLFNMRGAEDLSRGLLLPRDHEESGEMPNQIKEVLPGGQGTEVSPLVSLYFKVSKFTQLLLISHCFFHLRKCFWCLCIQFSHFACITYHLYELPSLQMNLARKNLVLTELITSGMSVSIANICTNPLGRQNTPMHSSDWMHKLCLSLPTRLPP